MLYSAPRRRCREEPVEESGCSRCGATGERLTLAKCPICFKRFCEACQVARGGRPFCSQYCADEFFFSEDD